jgi:hypothetical protein
MADTPKKRKDIMSNHSFIQALLAVTPDMTEAAENIGDLYRMGRPELWGQVYRAMLQVALANTAAPSAPEPKPVAWYRLAKADAAGQECSHGKYTVKVFEVNPHAVAWGKYKWHPVIDQPMPANDCDMSSVLKRLANAVEAVREEAYADWLAATMGPTQEESPSKEQFERICLGMREAFTLATESPAEKLPMLVQQAHAARQAETNKSLMPIRQGMCIGYQLAVALAPTAKTDRDLQQSEDAARWRALVSAGSELTLRLHNSRPDKREEVIDAYRTAQTSESAPC